jgi:hypothetical protein
VPRSLIIRSSRSPFAIVLMIACLVSGVAGLLPHEQRSTIDQLASGAAFVWYLGLLLGGTTVLAAMMLRLPTSLLLERVGLLLLTGLFLAYGVGIYMLLGFGPVRVGGVVILAFGVACGARVWQIGRDLRRLRQALTVSPVELADDGPHLADPDDSVRAAE